MSRTATLVGQATKQHMAECAVAAFGQREMAAIRLLARLVDTFRQRTDCYVFAIFAPSQVNQNLIDLGQTSCSATVTAEPANGALAEAATTVAVTLDVLVAVEIGQLISLDCSRRSS